MAPGKKGKKKELSEEQKQRIADQKALAEKEKLVRRHQLTVAFLKLKKDKEYRLLSLNDNKLLDLWRPRLRKLKIQELLTEFETKRASFEVAYQKKLQLVEEMENIMRHNNRQYDNTFNSHLNSMDKMLDFYSKRLKELEEKHSSNRQILLHTHSEDIDVLQQQHTKSLQYLNNVKDTVSFRNALEINESNKMFETREEQIRTKFMQSSLELTEEIGEKAKCVWLEINKVLTSYNRIITPNMREYQQLLKKDAEMSLDMDKTHQNICNLQIGIKKTNSRSMLLSKAYDNLMRSLQLKKSNFQTMYATYSNIHKSYKRKCQNSVAQLALSSHDVLEFMDSLLIQRDKTRRCIDRCIKLENYKMDTRLAKFVLSELLKNEKITELVTQQELEQIHNVDSHNTGNSVESATSSVSSVYKEYYGKLLKGEPQMTNLQINKVIDDSSLMEKFWKRFNYVCLVKAALESHKDNLKKDNYRLRQILRNYMTGMNPSSHAHEILQLNQFAILPTFLVSPVPCSPTDDSTDKFNPLYDEDVETVNTSLYALNKHKDSELTEGMPKKSQVKTSHLHDSSSKPSSTLMSKNKTKAKSNVSYSDKSKDNGHYRRLSGSSLNVIEGATVVQRWEKFGNFIPDVGSATIIK